ncbi:1,4-dihydroxy-6-naphthoate synthase [Marinicrinis sediminis]|uniref:1,4-dihydroxy-6-naphtoate synthase n=1 Tax=Marinicrinis sediminis TaxID=1652465 RepID=A0ABW5RCG3_9BACL
MKIAYSPCPNDTFIYHAWAHGLVPGAPELEVTYADIDITNHWALNGEGPEVMKISFAALPWALPDYRLLPCGGALGRGCGPLVLVKEQADHQALQPADLSGKKIAVPSERSTAYLLFRLWAAAHIPDGAGEIVVMPFHEIMPAVQKGEMDAGLVIHEARFTYPTYGLSMMTDLGSWWETETGLPIPLGAIVARRDLDHHAISNWIRSSLQYAWQHPEASRDYVMKHAQEMDADVARSHIQLYVNDFSMDLGKDGYLAIETLLTRAASEGLVPAFDPAMLRND